MSTPSRYTPTKLARHLKQSRSNYNGSNIEESLQDNYQEGQPSHSDYELVIEFELRREREKNRILEQRLQNKEMFIQQMKQYQQQLTIAFEKCQEELIAVRKTSQNFIKLERDYLEQIADLKHLIIRLQDEINFKQKEGAKRHYSSVKESQHASPAKSRKQRSKTLMDRQQSPKIKFQSSIEKQMIKESQKISKFLTHFLMMAECFEAQSKQGSLKHRLKVGWKWIKSVVKQWNDLKCELSVYESFLAKAQNRVKSKIKNSHQLEGKEDYLEAILKILK